MPSPSLNVAVIGAGPAGLMAAETLANGGARVTVYDHMPSAGRKFLMAGRGGLNLTHSEPLDRFMARYGAAEPWLRETIARFSPDDLRAWCESLGQPTFVGSSGRVFPKALKASPLLRAWLRRLDQAGVQIALRHRWTGWAPDGALVFDSPGGPVPIAADAVVLALGGASWPRLGSDGGWSALLQARGVEVMALRPANSGFLVAWSQMFRDRFEGSPLKGVALEFGARTTRGEIMVTRDGLEGGGIYALSSVLREEIAQAGSALLKIALRPDIATLDLVRRLSGPRNKQSLSTFLRKATGLSPVAIALLQESAITDGRSLSALSPVELAETINAVPVRLTGTASLARAISTAGGIAWSEVDDSFMLKRLSGVFVAGEMLDWEAPTGGYLLQASFATGVAAGQGALGSARCEKHDD
ncbi:TIGR03862 family flavoprotein [Bradyrhizobium prioriisuperbiae]|uniref:NAD(P)/FAD-dependent oxidoreductase n=1 Tax=Bradyrhizobium prioriisuperbiae TaxID=2854389 RepID=UPI0028E3CB42|nr:TIGR03862 family flavoprotein [Bradyrhizobium prioritasuperba]